MTPWLTPPTGAAASRAATLAAALPRIETERLILRAPGLADWPALEPIWTTPRSRHIDGPFTAEEAWLDFTQAVAGWLLRGYGPLTIAGKADGAVLGLIVLGFEYGDPEPELGWLLTAEAEGRGYATEAARALLPEALALLGPGRFVSYVDPANPRSARVAQKLGASRDPAAEAALAAAGPSQVWRHGGAA
jgi:RimJ/RimL family protein N-acetyltransferase